MAFSLTPASVSKQPALCAMTRATFTETPELATGCRDFSADRGDSAETKALLRDNSDIRPLNRHPRAVARGEKPSRLRPVQAHHPPA